MKVSYQYVYFGNMEVSCPVCVLWEYGGELSNTCIVEIWR